MTADDPWLERLSEYLDDELEPSARSACATHLAACDGSELVRARGSSTG